MRTVGTVVVVLALGGIGIAGLVDALRTNELGRPPAADRARHDDQDVVLEGSKRGVVCRPDQLRLLVNAYGPGTVAAVRHIRGPACHLRPMRVAVVARGPRGENPFARFDTLPQNMLSGYLSAGAQAPAIGLTYALLCANAPTGERFEIRAHAGPHRARRAVDCP